MQDFYFIINRIQKDGMNTIIFNDEFFSPSHLFKKLQEIVGEDPFSDGSQYHILMAEIEGSRHFDLSHCIIDKKTNRMEVCPWLGCLV